jgi:hypothetical protein
MYHLLCVLVECPCVATVLKFFFSSKMHPWYHNLERKIDMVIDLRNT